MGAGRTVCGRGADVDDEGHDAEPPVEEGARDDDRVGELRIGLRGGGEQVLMPQFVREERERADARVQGVGAELGGEEALDAHSGRGVDEGFLRGDGGGGVAEGRDDGVLAAEGGAEVGGGGVVDFEDVDGRGEEGGGGEGGAGQGADGEAGVVKGGDDGDADCAGDLGGRVSIAGVGVGVGILGRLTPATVTFLITGSISAVETSSTAAIDRSGLFVNY